MNRRHFLAATPAIAASCVPAKAAEGDDSAIRSMVQRYVEASVSEDPKVIESLLTPDADQLVSDGVWRKGRDELVKGMLESTKKSPAKPSIAVESVRMLSPEVALADGRYTLKGKEGTPDREMWTSITLKRGADGWRIAAIRNMLPSPQPKSAMVEEPDPQTVLNEARTLAQQGRYEEALKKHLWFHENALRLQPSMSGVRLSFALAYWVSLGEKYPKAREALVAIRDKDTAIMKTEAATVEVFADAKSINGYLGESPKTIELFKLIDARGTRLSDRCYIYAEDILAEAGEYALCSKYIRNPEIKLQREKTVYLMNVDREKQRPSRPEIPDMSGPMFVRNSCRLIEILVGAGRKQEAEKIQKQAIEVHDDQQIRDVIVRTEQKLKERRP